MKLAQKIRKLRIFAAEQMSRPLSQGQIAKMIHESTGQYISQGYLSQLENGTRTHLTPKSRNAIAQFYKIHPGYLVDDPEWAIELDAFHLSESA